MKQSVPCGIRKMGRKSTVINSSQNYTSPNKHKFKIIKIEKLKIQTKYSLCIDICLYNKKNAKETINTLLELSVFGKVVEHKLTYKNQFDF